MKKLLTTVLAFLLLLSAAVLPAAAETFSPAGTDLTLDIDTSIWYAFTSDNLEDNHELKTLGIDAQYMQNFFQTNNAYIDALLLYSDGDGYLEFYVRKKHSDDVVNLAPCTRQELEEFAEGLRKSDSGCTSAEVWENEYNFVVLERFDEPTGLYGQVYMTVVNSDLYAFTFQAPSPIDDSDRFYAKQTNKLGCRNYYHKHNHSK